MANLNETPLNYPDGVYQYERTDPALGGPPNAITKDGLLNIPLQQLAQRTAWLRAEAAALTDALAALQAGLDAGAIPPGTFSPGYLNQAFPTGLIVKAGQATADSSGSDPEVRITYPVAFPSATVGIAIAEMSDTTGQERAHLISVLDKTRTHFSVVVRSVNNTSVLAVSGFGWIAIGY